MRSIAIRAARRWIHTAQIQERKRFRMNHFTPPRGDSVPEAILRSIGLYSFQHGEKYE